MATYNATSLIVDDRDPSIVYSPGWEQVDAAGQYDDTKTGAADAGMTATFTFTGTAVDVYGSVGSIDVYGRPVTTYELDGVASTTATYQAQILAPGLATLNTLFYNSPSLPAGEHTLVITNINGTKPSVYWLDYIVYTPSDETVAASNSPQSNSPSPPSSPPPSSPPSSPSPASQSPPPSSQSSFTSASSPSAPTSQSSTSATTASSQSSSQNSPSTPSTANTALTSMTGFLSRSLSSQSITTSSGAPGALNSDQSFSNGSTHRAPAGAIAGGVVGGVALCAALLALLFWYCRRQKTSEPENYSPRPFGSWRDTAPGMSPFREKSEFESHRSPFYSQASQQDIAFDPFAGISPSVSTPQSNAPLLPATPLPQPSAPTTISVDPRAPMITPAEPQNAVRLHEDSGHRFPGGIVDVPPMYSQS